MRLVLAQDDGLNAAACDRLLARLAGERAAQDGEITIDLQAASFIDPYGAACLCLAARRLAERRRQIAIVLPSHPGARASVVQTGLVAALRPYAEVRNLPEKNLAVELLERLLEGEIKSKFASTLAQEKKFSELLDSVL